MHTDEKYIHVGNEHGYDLNAIDSKAKYVSAHSCVVNRTFPACVNFMRQIKNTCCKQILEIYEKEKHKPTKTMRDFGSHEGAESFLDLRPVIQNFVNPHQGLKGKPPAEIADADLKLGRNKLLNLIRYVAKHVQRR